MLLKKPEKSLETELVSRLFWQRAKDSEPLRPPYAGHTAKKAGRESFHGDILVPLYKTYQIIQGQQIPFRNAIGHKSIAYKFCVNMYHNILRYIRTYLCF